MIKNAQVKLLKIIILYLINKISLICNKIYTIRNYDKSLTQNTIALKFWTEYLLCTHDNVLVAPSHPSRPLIKEASLRRHIEKCFLERSMWRTVITKTSHGVPGYEPNS